MELLITISSIALTLYVAFYFRLWRLEWKEIRVSLDDSKSHDIRARLAKALKTCEPGFPDLRVEMIRFIILKTKEYHMATLYNPLRKKQIIYVAKSARKMPIEALAGCLAHEMVHLVEDEQKNLLTFPFTTISGFRRDETESERNIDTQAVNRGFGEHLIAFQKWANQHYKKYSKKDGLTINEIRVMLKESD